MQYIRLGSLDVSRFILGGNPISGFSHLTPDVDRKMVHYFSTAQVKRLLRDAEALGVNSAFMRADKHIIRLLMEYWDDGGKIQWLAQTAPELGAIEVGIRAAVNGGAKGVYVHGGVVDHQLLTGDASELIDAVKMIQGLGLPAGIAGHMPSSFEWAEQNLDVDFYMCCYYNPIDRAQDAANPGAGQERFRDEDRDVMMKTISTLSKPVIHYKILAAGRKDPKEAFEYVGKHIRPGDGVCVGVYDEDKPNMLAENVALFDKVSR